MDELFLKFARGLFILLLLFGLGMTVVILFGDHIVGLRMVNVFGTMFTGILGLGSGYLLGRSDRKTKENGKDRKEAA